MTPTIQDHLLATDRFRRSVLTTPFSPLNERKLRFQALFETIYSSLRLGGIAITKPDLTHILLHPVRRPSAEERQALFYRDTLRIIQQEWTANPKTLTIAGLEALVGLNVRQSEADLKKLLAYLASPQDHPVLLAGVLYGQLMETGFGHDSRGLIPRLLTSLILTKYGYDCRGMLALEPQWVKEPERHTKALQSIGQYGQLTVWLEHFTKTTLAAYEDLYRCIRHAGEGIETELPVKTWDLNDRQQRLLTLLDHPTAKVTNREVQHLFRVSQVTASRDLSHLTALGLLYVHGKGRSVSYTKL